MSVFVRRAQHKCHVHLISCVGCVGNGKCNAAPALRAAKEFERQIFTRINSMFAYECGAATVSNLYLQRKMQDIDAGRWSPNALRWRWTANIANFNRKLIGATEAHSIYMHKKMTELSFSALPPVCIFNRMGCEKYCASILRCIIKIITAQGSCIQFNGILDIAMTAAKANH